MDWHTHGTKRVPRRLRSRVHRARRRPPGRRGDRGPAARPGCAGRSPRQALPLTLWYDKPAGQWLEALPLGNGRLGAMVFGGVETEQLQLNEDTLWAGGPYEPANPQGLANLAEIRRRVFAGEWNSAQNLINSSFMGIPVGELMYQTVGNLRLTIPGTGEVSGYRRDLDLETAVATTTYTRGAVAYRREAFASHPDQVIVVRLTMRHPRRSLLHRGLRQPPAVPDGVPGPDDRRAGRDRADPRGRHRPGPLPRPGPRPRRGRHRTQRERHARGDRGRRGDPAGVRRHQLQRLPGRLRRPPCPRRARTERRRRRPRTGGCAPGTSPTTVRSSAGSRSTSAPRRRPGRRPTGGSPPSPRRTTRNWSPCTTSTAATCSSPPPARAPSPRTSRASGTTSSHRPGTPSTRSTSIRR